MYAHVSASTTSQDLNDFNLHFDAPQNMGNNQSQKMRKSGKLPAPSLARTKDSGYRSGSASSSETALKAARANDQMTASTGNVQASISEAAQATVTVCRNDAIYRTTNRVSSKATSPSTSPALVISFCDDGYSNTK